MTTTRPMCRNIAATSRAKHPDAKTAQVDAVIKLLVDGHSKLTLMLVKTRLPTEATPRAWRTQKGSHG